MALSVIASAVVVAAPDMQEGNWETTMEMKMEPMEGMPFAMPPIVYKDNQCLTKMNMVPNTAQKDQECKMLEYKVSGNTVIWKTHCVTKEATGDFSGEVTYRGNTYQGTAHTRFATKDKGAPPMVASYKLSGMHIGDCKK